MSNDRRGVIVTDNALTVDIDIGRSILDIDGGVSFDNAARESRIRSDDLDIEIANCVKALIKD